MTTVLSTLPDYYFYLQHNRKVTKGTFLTYVQTMKNFCRYHGKKETKELLPTHIIRFVHSFERECQKKPGHKVAASTIYSHMIRLKAYLKRLCER